ncbi:MAG: N-acetylmuramoyl-L-alanine amidase [Bryobacteraceae bacterium]
MRRMAQALLVSLAAVASLAAQGQLRLKSVKHTSSSEVTRVIVETTGAPKYRSQTLADPERLLFDFLNTTPDDGKPGIRTVLVRDSRLRQIRIAETKPGRTRVVLDLKETLEYRIGRDSRPGKLIIELRSDKNEDAPEPPAISSAAKLEKPATAIEKPLPTPEQPKPAARPETRAEREKTAAQKLAEEEQRSKETGPKPAARSESPAEREKTVAEKLAEEEQRPQETGPKLAARFESRAEREKTVGQKPIEEEPRPEQKAPRLRAPEESRPPRALPARGSSSMIRALGLKMGRVVIDPGHGGHDQGTSSRNGLLEKELVLDISKRLGALLEERLGVEVLYTRTDDTFVPLETRTELANQKRADLFLSIHANSSPYRGAAGVETYYLNLTSSREALEIAARENAASSRSVHELTGIIQDIATNDKILESRDFAQKMQTALFPVSSRYNPNAHNRGAKKAPFVVLLGAAMPSVLTEIGFLSNPREEALLKKPEHRQRIAEALFTGVKRYAETLSHFQIATKD